MRNDMSDERFDEWVRKAAADYNQPPDIAPRDAMWEVVARGTTGAHETSSGVAGQRATRESRFQVLRRQPWTWAAAAVLLLATGIGIGRLSTANRAPITNPASGARRDVVAAPGPSTLIPDTPRLDTRRPAVAPPPSSREPGAETPTGYDLAAREHLTAAEALLTSFRVSREASMDAGMRRWARDLLSTTRLLLGSPAAGDAQRRRLLEDLELVLVQIVQLPPNVQPLDREFIDRAIARQQVLTRIQTSITSPPRSASGT